MEGKQTRHQYIMESMSGYPEYRKIYQDWHDIGSILNESPVSQEQVQAIFKAIADGAKAGGNVAKAGDAPGNNRTMLGKGTDAASKIAGKWNDLKFKIQNSGVVPGFDTAFDSLQKAVLDKAGGEAGKIGKALNAYKQFATKYPKMQGAIYAGLAILAGLSGWGLGAVAITAGIRTLDRLLQGDKLSSAAWKGFKTGAIGAVFAGISGAQAASPDAVPTDGAGGAAAPTNWGQDYVVKQGDTLSQIAQNNHTSVEKLLQMNDGITNPDVLDAGQQIKIPNPINPNLPDAVQTEPTYKNNVGTAADTASKEASGAYAANKFKVKESIDRVKIQRIWKNQERMNLPQQSAVYLTSYGISNIFRGCEKQAMISEGMWDSFKKAAKTGWENATNKITYSGLDNTWRRNYGEQTAEGTVDTEEVVAFLKKMGVLDGLIQKTFSDLKIPYEPTVTPGSATGTAADPAFDPDARGTFNRSDFPAAGASDAPAGGASAPAGGASAPAVELTPDQMVEIITPVTAQVKDLMDKLKSNQGNRIGNPKVRAALKALADFAIDMSNSTGSTAPIKKGNEPGTFAEGSDQIVSASSTPIPYLAKIADAALDAAYHYGRSQPGNTFGWQANLKSAEFAKKIIDAGVTDIEHISDAIHNGWNVTAREFVKNPDKFDDTEKLRAAGKLDAKLEQRAKLMSVNYAQLPEEEKEKDRVVARAILKVMHSIDTD